MKALIYIISFLIAAFVNMIIKDSDIAYNLAYSLHPNDVSARALLAGAISGILTVANYGICVFLLPRILIKGRERRIANKMKRNAKKVSNKLNISEDILAHCEFVGNNEQLMSYLQTCVNDGLLTQEQSDALAKAYKRK